MPEIINKIHPKGRKEWRDWLRKNHRKENDIWVIKYKRHTKKPTITNKEAMEEAICFGWIDTIVKRIDDEKYSQRFVKRNDKSRWSKNTLSYAKRLKKEGKMSKFGLKMYEKGLKKPALDHDIPKNPKTPKDLIEALKKNKEAKKNFNNFAPSYKRFYIYWINNAKRKETRKKRIDIVYKRSKENKKPGE